MNDLLSDMDPPPVTLTEAIKEVERELKFRKRVYPRMIRSGRLSPGAANRQFDVMHAILKHLNGTEPLQ